MYYNPRLGRDRASLLQCRPKDLWNGSEKHSLVKITLASLPCAVRSSNQSRMYSELV